MDDYVPCAHREGLVRQGAHLYKQNGHGVYYSRRRARIQIGGKRRPLASFLWSLRYGAPPDPSHVVVNQCGDPACVAPECSTLMDANEMRRGARKRRAGDLRRIVLSSYDTEGDDSEAMTPRPCGSPYSCGFSSDVEETDAEPPIKRTYLREALDTLGEHASIF